MNKLVAIVERADKNYSAYLDVNDAAITATGKTLDEIKNGIYESIRFMQEECAEFGYELPKELEGDFEVTFKMDVSSLLEYYASVFTKAGLERITGINQKQLWHYASGERSPRPEQVLKIETALHKLGQELISIQL